MGNFVKKLKLIGFMVLIVAITLVGCLPLIITRYCCLPFEYLGRGCAWFADYSDALKYKLYRKAIKPIMDRADTLARSLNA